MVRRSRAKRTVPRRSSAAGQESASLDLKQIRRDPGVARAALARRGAADALDELLALDERRRVLLPEVESGRARRNDVSRQIGEAKRTGAPAEEAIAEMRDLSGRLKELEAELTEVEARREALAVSLPNIPAPDAPDGDSDADAELIRTVGDPPEFGFEPRDHLDLGRAHGVIDMEAGARVSGSRFAYLLGELVFVEMALVRFALSVLHEEGFTPVVPPVLVREEALVGTGFFPGEREMIYEIPRDELFLIGTSEVPLAGLHAGELIEDGVLPRRYAGFSTCFRREAGAAGRDTRGIFRVHQFDKVEMFSFVAPEDSVAEHERILALEERILQALEIPYRVISIPVGDLGAPAAKKYDCEAWIPSQQRYREVTSCSNTTDYQARRMDCRYRPAAGEAPIHVHTLNGTAVAVGRTLIALMENGQQADGSVRLPEALGEYGSPAAIGTR
ncbi:MAG: serine--tRNA ligase [Solirubrobacterales bacterium]